MSEHEVYIFDGDPERVVSVTVGELRGLCTDEWEYCASDEDDSDISIPERTCHFCLNEDIVHTDIGDEDYGEYVCSACGSPLPDYLQDVADQMQAGCCDEPILWCPACGARVVGE